MAPQRPGAADSADPNNPARPTSIAAPPLTAAPAAIAITQRPAAALVAALPTPAPADPAPSQPKPPIPAAPTTSEPPRIELPTSNADYLQNNKANYPALSRRLGEQGQVMLRVLIGADGVAQKAEISTSSGYERLDQAALATVLRWRYAPGRRAGVPETMWFSVPINFELK